MTDFGIFDDRAATLWRKPYLDGAVRELTSGNDKSVDQLRLAVEQMILAKKGRLTDVRASRQPAARERPIIASHPYTNSAADATAPKDPQTARSMGLQRTPGEGRGDPIASRKCACFGGKRLEDQDLPLFPTPSRATKTAPAYQILLIPKPTHERQIPPPTLPSRTLQLRSR